MTGQEVLEGYCDMCIEDGFNVSVLQSLESQELKTICDAMDAWQRMPVAIATPDDDWPSEEDKMHEWAWSHVRFIPEQWIDTFGVHLDRYFFRRLVEQFFILPNGRANPRARDAVHAMLAEAS